MAKKQKFDGAAILGLPMTRNDANAKTVRGYFVALLGALWQEGEGFSGKRPFGNSGWESELHAALVKGGVVNGAIDPQGYLESIDEKAANQAIYSAIDAL